MISVFSCGGVGGVKEGVSVQSPSFDDCLLEKGNGELPVKKKWRVMFFMCLSKSESVL